MSTLQMETLASNVASAFDINYLDVLSKIGITPEVQLVAIEKLLNTIGKELTNSKTVETMETIWRLMWMPNFSDDIGGNLTSGKYYYLCINNYRLKCIRDKTVELYNMKQTELANQTPLASDAKKKSSKAAPIVDVPVTPTTTDEKKKKAPPKKKEPVTESTIAETPTTEAPVADAPVVEKKKRAPPKKKESVTESTTPETPVAEAPVADAPVVEKKKRAPPKKKEPVVPTTTESPVTDSPVAEVPVVEKKKRAPAKKKEPVVVSDEVA